MHTENFRRQHDEAREKVEALRAGLREPAPDPRSLSAALNGLAGLLRIHFAMEDRSLYPSLLESRDPAVARAALSYRDEMGDISPAFAAFVERWRGPLAIGADLPAFAAECEDVLPRILERIDREDRVLYEMADRAFGARAR